VLFSFAICHNTMMAIDPDALSAVDTLGRQTASQHRGDMILARNDRDQ
jgi:hypothetical protein